MKAFFINLVVAACALHEGHAFSSSILPPTSSRPITSLSSATIGSSNPRSSKNDQIATMSSPTVVELREMDTIRAELVDKYIALGHTEEVSLLLGSHYVMCRLFHWHSLGTINQSTLTILSLVCHLLYSMPPEKLVIF